MTDRSQAHDPCDIEPLTPNHLLLIKVQPNMPPGTFNKDDQYLHTDHLY